MDKTLKKILIYFISIIFIIGLLFLCFEFYNFYFRLRQDAASIASYKSMYFNIMKQTDSSRFEIFKKTKEYEIMSNSKELDSFNVHFNNFMLKNKQTLKDSSSAK